MSGPLGLIWHRGWFGWCRVDGGGMEGRGAQHVEEAHLYGVAGVTWCHHAKRPWQQARCTELE